MGGIGGGGRGLGMGAGCCCIGIMFIWLAMEGAIVVCGAPLWWLW